MLTGTEAEHKPLRRASKPTKPKRAAPKPAVPLEGEPPSSPEEAPPVDSKTEPKDDSTEELPFPEQPY